MERRSSFLTKDDLLIATISKVQEEDERMYTYMHVQVDIYLLTS